MTSIAIASLHILLVSSLLKTVVHADRVCYVCEFNSVVSFDHNDCNSPGENYIKTCGSNVTACLYDTWTRSGDTNPFRIKRSCEDTTEGGAEKDAPPPPEDGQNERCDEEDEELIDYTRPDLGKAKWKYCRCSVDKCNGASTNQEKKSV